MKKFTLVLCLLAGHFAHAQVPNGGFEIWQTPTGASYMEPQSWTTSNGPLSDLPVPAPANVTQETTTVAEGTSAVKLTTSSILGGAAQASGAISSGNITYDPINTTLTFDGGFAFTDRPGSLTGMLKYTPVGGDTAHIWIVLTRWNAGMRDTIAMGSVLHAAATATYVPFGVVLNYMSTEEPDTALIVALSSKRIVILGGAPGSTLWLDDLALEFGASVEGINNVKSINAYPNPANDRLVIEAAADEYTEARVFDMTGRLVNTLPIENNGVNVSTLTSGNYVLEVTGRNGVARTAFSKQ
ncbi:MAG TPA: PCMD domain-containing protein [Chitinophagales bacterium]|nr:PCMD domain-containing protein [Chitinophagales bacterium]